MAGLRVGQVFRVALATWVWGQQLLGTQHPYATQALKLFSGKSSFRSRK